MGFWRNVWATGPRMFSLPTGAGCGCCCGFQ
jgi:hypothetical protein